MKARNVPFERLLPQSLLTALPCSGGLQYGMGKGLVTQVATLSLDRYQKQMCLLLLLC